MKRDGKCLALFCFAPKKKRKKKRKIIWVTRRARRRSEKKYDSFAWVSGRAVLGGVCASWW